MRNVLAAVLIAGATITLPAQGTSKWVYLGQEPRLHYTADARGNRIMDFSHAGYKGGGVGLPNVPVARRLQPSAGDNTAQIQAAIDEVSRLAQDRTGSRGAVLLGAGTYTVAGALKIAASGVVLRGGGSGEGGHHGERDRAAAPVPGNRRDGIVATRLAGAPRSRTPTCHPARTRSTSIRPRFSSRATPS